MLIIDRAARTISGRAVPYGVVGIAPTRAPRRFLFGSLYWNEWPPLVLEHDQSLRVGKTSALQLLEDGLWAIFRASHGARGDLALEKAATTHTGLSVGVDLDTAEFRFADDGVHECVSARLVEISLTRNPVFP